MLISLVVVGGAIAIVLWITVGDMAQPATKDDEPAGSPDDGQLTVVIPVEAGVAVDDRDAPAGAVDEGAPGGPAETRDDSIDSTDSDARDDVTDGDLHADDAAAIGPHDTVVDDGPALDDDHDDALGDPGVAADVAPDEAPDDESATADDVRPADVTGLVAAEGAPAPTTADTPHGVMVADAMGPVEGTVPQAVPARPAESATAGRAPSAAGSVVTIPGTYSFDPAPPVTWGRRLRSALGVVLVVTAVGLALAASLGLLAVYVSRALEGAVN